MAGGQEVDQASCKGSRSEPVNRVKPAAPCVTVRSVRTCALLCVTLQNDRIVRTCADYVYFVDIVYKVGDSAQMLDASCRSWAYVSHPCMPSELIQAIILEVFIRFNIMNVKLDNIELYLDGVLD